MKKLILILLFVTSTNFTFGQKIERNEIDEFTGQAIKETSWEILNRGSKLNSYVKFRNVDNRIYLYFRMGLGLANQVFSIDEGEVLFMKFTDDEILKISNLKYQISSTGGGTIGLLGSRGLGVELISEINSETLKKLEEKTLAKVRVYTSVGFTEADVNKKRAENFKELAKLID